MGPTRTRPAELLRIGNLACVELEALLDLAARMKAAPGAWVGALSGATLGWSGERPALPARASLEVAAHRLGMLPIELDAEELRPDGVRSVTQVARFLESQGCAVLALTASQARLRALAREVALPIINALSDQHEPLQALADLLTLSERFGELSGRVVAYSGAPGPAAHSLMEAGAIAGMEVRLACPPGRLPPPEIQLAAEIMAERHGGAVTVSDDAWTAVGGADAVATAPWSSPAAEAELRRYRVTPRLMAKAKPDAVFLHALPAHAGQEVSAAVIEGPASIVWDQASNRVPAEQAAIYTLARGAAER